MLRARRQVFHGAGQPFSCEEYEIDFELAPYSRRMPDGTPVKGLSQREVVRRLLFKILSAENFRPRDVGPVLLQ